MQLAGRLCGVVQSEEENLMIWDRVEGSPAASCAQRGSTKGHVRCAAVWYSASHRVTCPGFLCLAPQISDLTTKMGGTVKGKLQLQCS